MLHRAFALAVAVSALALAGCGGDVTDPQAGAASTREETASAPAAPPLTTTPGPSSAPPAAEVPEALDFTAPTVDGGTFDGASLAGKPAVLWFWAPWCPVCKRGAGAVTAAAAELGADVAFVGVAGLSGSVEDMQEFIEDTDSGSIPHIADVDGAVFTRFEIPQQDTFAFVGTDGTVELVDGYSGDPDLVEISRERFGL